MRKILIFGAGRSSVTLIRYLIDNSLINNWFVTIIDASEDILNEESYNSSHSKAVCFDIKKKEKRKKYIIDSDVVVSMLPARMHIMIARDCLEIGRHLVTASYISDEIRNLNKEVKAKDLIFLNEIGLDPGIDHMSAMKLINEIKDSGSELISFRSFCGGLIHPEYDNNPWNYKFTWNPRNVVLAGQGTAKYIRNGKYKYIPYNKLFQRYELINVLKEGEFEGYANRDSLSYRSAYGIQNIDTLFRGTLRKKGYCMSWNAFVQIGMTDDTYVISNTYNMTYREFTNLFFPYNEKLSVEEKFCQYLKIDFNSHEFKKFEWLGVFSEKRISHQDATPAKILQEILEDKWAMDSSDKDMVIMQHQFEYLQDNKRRRMYSSLVVFGDDPKYTAMSKTVGLPVAIAVKLILDNKINLRGVCIPTDKQIYLPVLEELSDYGINFIDQLV